MRLSGALFCFVALTACGRSENKNLVDAVPNGRPSSQGYSHSDEGVTGKELGLSSVNGFQYGSAVSGAKIDMDKAFRSFVNYQNVFGKRCSGVLATDKISEMVCSGTGDGESCGLVTQTRTYFYTARHCFEKWTPIGFRSQFTVKMSNPLSYASPWLAGNAFTRSIMVGSPEKFSYSDGRTSDVIRIYQSDKSPANFLPLCKSMDFTSAEYDSHQAVGFTNPRKTTNLGVVWANMTTSVPSDLPTSMKNTMATATDSSSFLWANGVLASPGDSGAPIWGIKRASDGVGVYRYTCLAGVVARELWKAEGCDTTKCNMRGESVFEKLKGFTNTSGGSWTPF